MEYFPALTLAAEMLYTDVREKSPLWRAMPFSIRLRIRFL